MLIDWFTVAAQALNFLILVWLLQRWLYRPILDAIDARERGIAAALAEAEAGAARARAQRADYEQQAAQLEAQRAGLLRQAQADARQQGAALLEAARAAAEAARAGQRRALEAEQRELGEELQRRTQRQVFAIARQTLAELAGATLEQRMTEVFLARLGALDADARAALRTALAAPDGAATLRSAVELGPAQRTALRQALEACCGQPLTLRYESAPQLLGGIEFSSGGYQLGWNIDAYLAQMERCVGDALRQSSQDASAAAPAAAP